MVDDIIEFTSNLNINKKVIDLVLESKDEIEENFKKHKKISAINQAKVLNAFKSERVSSMHFNPTTGYGYSDAGREKLCSVFAKVFKAEHALVSPHILSGTHAIYLALSSFLFSCDMILSVAGKPYDTLSTAIGVTSDAPNSLINRGVAFDQVELTKEGKLDFEQITNKIKLNKPKVIYIQRSRGYDYRSSINIKNIEKLVAIRDEYSEQSFVICDNCYGEFCETKEPIEVGVDVIIGSLIKNPGGGIAPNGGYIAGKKDLIETVEYNFTAPGIGHEVGSYNASYIPFYQGLFLAPKVVEQSINGAILTSYVMKKLGYDVMPNHIDARTDITQSIKFNTKDELINFIQGIQMGSPVESFVKPMPWDMPGYEEDVIMAAGTFIQGASIELSADAPIKEPYIAYIQGGLTFEYHMFGLMYGIDNMGIL